MRAEGLLSSRRETDGLDASDDMVRCARELRASPAADEEEVADGRLRGSFADAETDGRFAPAVRLISSNERIFA